MYKLRHSYRSVLSEHYHTKRKVWYFLIIPVSMARDDFQKARKLAKVYKGRYSPRFFHVPAGFAFDTKEAAQMFATDVLQGEITTEVMIRA